MRLAKTISALAFCLMASLGLCRAQTLAPTTTELDLDLRTRIAGVNGSGTRLNTSALRVSTGLTPNLSISAYGTKKYAGYSPQECFVEVSSGMNRFQAGIVRLPFGIYDTRETYATGLIDYPMPRCDFAYNSVDWGVPGVRWSGGSSQLQVEAAAFGGRSYNLWDSANTVRGGAVRLQTYTHGLILGVSRWDGSLQPLPGVPGMASVHLNGVDARYTLPHLLLRGELIKGEMAGNQEEGWYIDAYYHLPGLAKWTATTRLEQFKPGGDYPMSHQITVGARYVASPQWTLSVNWRRNNALGTYHPAWTTYAGKGGDVFFQVYRKFVY